MKRKELVVLIDGMADFPLAELDGKTPLEAAKKPCMDGLAEKSTLGMLHVTPDGCKGGSEVGNLSILGYDDQPQVQQLPRPLKRCGRNALAVFKRLVYFRAPAMVFHGLRIGKVIVIHAPVRMDERHAKPFLRQPRKGFPFSRFLAIGKDAREYAPIGAQIVHDAVFEHAVIDP